MRLKEWSTSFTKKLTEAGIGSSQLDCLILLEDELGKDRSWILAHPEEKINQKQLTNLNKKLARRATHEPLAYIRGFSEFYGRRFLVNRHVLEPRPESETMIELLKQLPIPNKPTIVDVGTGSGALGITIKLELLQAKVIVVDIDPACLRVARANARSLRASVKFLKSDLIQVLKTDELADSIILANLPYVPTKFWINQAAAMEPRLAIFGGPDGLEIYRRLFDQFKQSSLPRFIITESLPPQHKTLEQIAKRAGLNLYKSQDFVQIFKS